MKKKRTKPGESDNEILNAIPEACKDETVAVEFMEKMRWGKTPACPRCGDLDVSMMKDKDGNRNKRFLWRCHGCKKQFTVRIGTILEDSRIPVRIWCHAFWRACSSKKGVSALQISRECRITYKSALFLMHRIRFAMAGPNSDTKLKGDVEVDETYIGGRPRYQQKQLLIPNRPKMTTGRGTKKTPVLGLLERGGSIRTHVLTDVTKKTLRPIIEKYVDKSASRLFTDELNAYVHIGKEFTLGHDRVKHRRNEYARGDVTTNTIESFFGLVKRGIYGTFHNVSKKHLHRYLSEFEFRWMTRKNDDGERIVAAIRNAEGKRLMYYQPATNEDNP